MSSDIPISVCIVALTSDADRARFISELREDLLAARSAYDIDKDVYGHVPDDWKPFIDNVTIMTHIHNAGFTTDTYSRDLGPPEKLAAVLEKVTLYVFDPLYLVHESTGAILMNQLQAAIVAGRKEFCIIFSKSLPEALRDKLATKWERDMHLLNEVYRNQGIGAWRVETAVDLRAYLKRLLRALSAGPVGKQMQLMAMLLSDLGAASPNLNAAPRLVGGDNA